MRMKKGARKTCLAAAAIAFVVIVALLSSQKPEKPAICTLDARFCSSDDDCICSEEGCFVGNREYFKSCLNETEKSRTCLDLCSGWGQKLPQCKNNRCVVR